MDSEFVVNLGNDDSENNEVFIVADDFEIIDNMLHLNREKKTVAVFKYWAFFTRDSK